jgi:hypothetical protein
MAVGTDQEMLGQLVRVSHPLPRTDTVTPGKIQQQAERMLFGLGSCDKGLRKQCNALWGTHWRRDGIMQTCWPWSTSGTEMERLYKRESDKKLEEEPARIHPEYF